MNKTQQEIIEGNKLIHKFMNIPLNPNGIFDTILQYNSSWDWLMPVVEKIAKLDEYCLKTSQSLTISNRWYIYSISIFKNTFEGLENPILKIHSDYENNESKISTYWRFTIEFIKWYNENKNK